MGKTKSANPHSGSGAEEEEEEKAAAVVGREHKAARTTRSHSSPAKAATAKAATAILAEGQGSGPEERIQANFEVHKEAMLNQLEAIRMAHPVIFRKLVRELKAFCDDELRREKYGEAQKRLKRQLEDTFGQHDELMAMLDSSVELLTDEYNRLDHRVSWEKAVVIGKLVFGVVFDGDTAGVGEWSVSLSNSDANSYAFDYQDSELTDLAAITYDNPDLGEGFLKFYHLQHYRTISQELFADFVRQVFTALQSL